MSNRLAILLSVAAAATMLTVGTADAQARHIRHVRVTAATRPVVLAEMKAPPLVVKKRSFLDPGNVVPVGSDTPTYITANTVDHQPIYSSFSPAKFGESTLPGRFDLPNNPRFNDGNTNIFDFMP